MNCYLGGKTPLVSPGLVDGKRKRRFVGIQRVTGCMSPKYFRAIQIELESAQQMVHSTHGHVLPDMVL